MSKDATLDAFATQESTDESEGSDDADEAAVADAAVRDDAPASQTPDTDAKPTDSVDPVAVTSSWSATATCPDCGDDAPRLWRNGDGSVCAACKTWQTTGEGPCDR